MKRGDLVKLISTNEIGVVVHIWYDNGIEDTYVSFFGKKMPNGKPDEKPYVLRYFTSSLELLEES